MLRLVIALLVSILALAPAEVRAERSGELLGRAIGHYKTGELAQALDLLERAHQALKAEVVGRGGEDHAPAAQIYLYQGLCQAVTQKPSAARQSFARALEADPDLRLDPRRFKPQIVRLFDEVRGTLRAMLVVTADRTGVRVLVDGSEVGQAPLETSVGTGRHRVEVRSADRRQARSAVVDLTAGARRIIDFRLGSTSERRPDRSATHPMGGTRRLWTWIAGGASLVTLATGIAVYLSADASYNELDSSYDQLYLEGNAARIEELRRQVQRKDTAAVVMLSLSGALAASAVTLFFLEPWLHRRSSKRSACILPLVGPASGLALDLRF